MQVPPLANGVIKKCISESALFSVCSAFLNLRNISYKSRGFHKNGFITYSKCLADKETTTIEHLFYYIHCAITKQTHTFIQLINVPVCCVLPADTHRHTDGHTDPLSSPGDAQISATYSLLFSKHSQKE